MVKVHRMYRRRWWRPSKEITERDLQAMYNFHEEGISDEVLAEHFCCDASIVTEAMTRPWRRSKSEWKGLGQTAGKRRAWWESDHSDPLELVKLYYPHQIVFYRRKISPEIKTKEQVQKPFIDVPAYLERAFGSDFVSLSNILTADEVLADIVNRLEEYEIDYSAEMLLSLLDERLEVKREKHRK